MTDDLHPPSALATRSRYSRRAWWCLALSPVAVILAFVAGEGLTALMGYTGEGLPPWWVGAAAVLAGAVLLGVPTLLARWWARRAASEGDRSGRTPATILLALWVSLLLVNLLSWLARVVLEG